MTEGSARMTEGEGGNDIPLRHPRENGDPDSMTKMDSRFRENDRGEAGMTGGSARMTSLSVIPVKTGIHILNF